MSKQTPPAPTASALRPCPTVIQIGRTPVTGSLPSTIAPPHGAMVLGKLPVTGRTATFDKGRQGPTALAVGAGGGCLDSFFLPSIIFLFLLPLSGKRPDIGWLVVFGLTAL